MYKSLCLEVKSHQNLKLIKYSRAKLYCAQNSQANELQIHMDWETLSQDTNSIILGRGQCKSLAIFHGVLSAILLLQQETSVFPI